MSRTEKTDILNMRANSLSWGRAFGLETGRRALRKDASPGPNRVSPVAGYRLPSACIGNARSEKGLPRSEGFAEQGFVSIRRRVPILIHLATKLLSAALHSRIKLHP